MIIRSGVLSFIQLLYKQDRKIPMFLIFDNSFPLSFIQLLYKQDRKVPMFLIFDISIWCLSFILKPSCKESVSFPHTIFSQPIIFLGLKFILDKNLVKLVEGRFKGVRIPKSCPNFLPYHASRSNPAQFFVESRLQHHILHLTRVTQCFCKIHLHWTSYASECTRMKNFW